MNKEYKIKVLRPYRGLHEGDILVFNKESDLFELREIDEVVADNYHSKNTRMVGFSTSFVERFHNQLFEDLDGFFADDMEQAPTPEKEPEKEPEDIYSVDIDKIKDIGEMVEKLTKEVEQLKKQRKTSKRAKK